MSIIEKLLASGLAFLLGLLLINGAIFYTLGQAYMSKLASIFLALN